MMTTKKKKKKTMTRKRKRDRGVLLERERALRDGQRNMPRCADAETESSTGTHATSKGRGVQTKSIHSIKHADHKPISHVRAQHHAPGRNLGRTSDK